MDGFAPRSGPTRRVAPAVGLFALSPMVAEYLLGNISVDHLALLLVIAPLYGGGAILVREVARRRQGGWPAILLLAFAYAVLEEGLVTQTLFNPSYFGFELLRDAHVAWLGIGGWWSLFVLTLHTVWSIAVPIAIVEALAPGRAREPWLGRGGLVVASLLFLLGAWMNAFFTYAQEKFMASGLQLAGASLVAAAAMVAGLRAREVRSDRPGSVPPPVVAGLSALVIASAFMTARWFVGGWSVVIAYVALFAAMIALVRTWSSRLPWSDAHALALAGGALVTYAWHSFVQDPVIGGKGAVDVAGNVVFATGSVVVLLAAWRRVHRR